MKKLLIGLVIGLVAIIAVITLSPLRFVLAPEPLRPYHATSQNYLDTVADFESTPIKDKDDLIVLSQAKTKTGSQSSMC